MHDTETHFLDDAPEASAIPVRLERVLEDSVAASICALVQRGAMLRPELAADIEGSVVLSFHEGYPPVRIDFRGAEIVVGDTTSDDCAHDLIVEARLPDTIALIAAPLAAGLPNPTAKEGRAALARLADGRVEMEGSLKVARQVLKLLAVTE